MEIEKKILQIAIGEKYVKSLPLQRIKDNLLKLNDTYEYILYTDKEIFIFLTTLYPQYIDLYNALQRPQYKSDLIRYLYLYTFGGWYIDIDILPTLSLSSIYQKTENSNLICMEGAHTNPEKGVFEMANGFLGSKKGNPVFIELVDLMKEEPNPSDYGENVKRLYKKLQYNESIFIFKERQGPDGKYYIVYNQEIIGLSNGHGYPGLNI